MAEQHTPGRQCDACEGFCLLPPPAAQNAGIALALSIGQHVRHRDYKGRRVTGTVRSIGVENGGALMVTIALDEAIVIPALTTDDREIRLHTQYVPAHELAPFDGRDELIAEMLAALQPFIGHCSSGPKTTITVRSEDVQRARAVIAKAGPAA